MNKKRTFIFLTALAVVVILFAAASYFMGLQTFNASTSLVTNEETSGAESSGLENYGVDYEAFCRTYQIDKAEIVSSQDGHIIPAEYIFAPLSNLCKNHETVIMVHGLGDNRYTNYAVAQVFLERNYNVLTYDQRNTNENFAQRSTYGYLEKFDLIDCINFVRNEAPDKPVGVWGTSFGGATAVLAAGFADNQSTIDFLILDCPLSSMEWMIAKEIEKMEIPIPTDYLLWCGNFVNRLKLGFSYADADVCAAAKKISLPVLVINSEADTVTPFFMGKEIFDSFRSENKTLWTVSNSEHAMMWRDFNTEYRARIAELTESLN